MYWTNHGNGEASKRTPWLIASTRDIVNPATTAMTGPPWMRSSSKDSRRRLRTTRRLPRGFSSERPFSLAVATACKLRQLSGPGTHHGSQQESLEHTDHV
jgi:hypothetical protein